MGSILTQEEVNALLKGVASGEIDVETASQKVAEGIRKYDFSSQDRIIRGRMPTLEIINERFARSLRSAISIALGKMVNIEIVSYKTLKFSEFMKGVPIPSSLNILKFDPLRGHVLLVLDPSLVFTLVDIFFGGSGQNQIKVEGRDFTHIEQRMIRKVVEMTRAELEKAWKPVVPLDIAHVRSEVNPQFASIVPPTEVVIVVSMNLEIEHFSGGIFVCLPYSTIEPVKDKLYAGFQSEQLEVDQRWIMRLAEVLRTAKVRAVVELGRSKLRMRELANLKTGDVILLNADVEDELKMKVEGITKFLGRPGVYNNRTALKITRTVGGSKDA
jgi:flagellar motor switch protein FliM